MDKHPVKKENDSVVVTDERGIHPLFSNFFYLPFIRFTYSQTSIRSDGNTTHVAAEEHRFEKGKLDSRYFDGTLAGDFLEPVVRMVEQQMDLMIRSMNLFLPFKTSPDK